MKVLSDCAPHLLNWVIARHFALKNRVLNRSAGSLLVCHAGGASAALFEKRDRRKQKYIQLNVDLQELLYWKINGIFPDHIISR